jgi:hypothetical protein
MNNEKGCAGMKPDMTSHGDSHSNTSQSDKFKEAARELEADEDEKHWEERLKRVAKAKPEKPE